MEGTITADDLWPLVAKLTPEQKVKLARRAIQSATGEASDADRYRAMPPVEDEFGGEDAAASWEAEGWEEFYEAR